MVADDFDVHREGDRALDVELDVPDDYSEWDAEPTFEKWRRGRTWS